MTTTPARRLVAAPAVLDTLLLAVVAYVPFLLSAPGRVSSDSKQALYVDPGGFLVDAVHLWDPSVGAGTVPHQHIGYLWPMGPWFWFFETIGVPDWVAQRLWLGTLTLLAALGVRWLCRSLGLGRSAALAAALVYALTPYQLAFTARTSVLLLPWVGLPWLVELTRRALAYPGWRHPALISLVVVTVAGVNAPSLLLVGLAPLAVIVGHAVRGRAAPREALGATVRIAALALPASAWWLAGLRLQGAYGMPVLQLTENLRTVAADSSPDDVLRGLGNWFFYGSDRRGWSLDQAGYYADSRTVVLASYLVPFAALAAAAALRWRHRALAVLLLGATVVAVGAWPWADPSPFGRAFRAFAEGTSVGLAFRNSPRVVPVVVLGMALLLGAAVAATPRRWRVGAATAVGLAAIAGLAPVLRTGMLSDGVDRPEELPDHWIEAAAHLDDGSAPSRVLELPGANFAAYRWGNAIEPVTPLLSERPYVAREVLPYGSPASALLLDALDRRLQTGVLDPDSVAPVARLLGVGDVVIRSDLQHERFGLPSPDLVWERLVASDPAGLGDPTTFGSPVPNVGAPHLDLLSPVDLVVGRQWDRDSAIPPVAVLPVEDPRPTVRVAPVAEPIVLAGDADGIVDAAGSGPVDGRSIVLLSAGLDDAALDAALEADAHLVVTDSYRRRIQTWFYSLSETRGPTEQAGETLVEPTGYDARLDPFPDAPDEARTVVEHLGATVTATTSGGGAARPEDRPVAALDGRLSTSWRVGGADPTGHRLVVQLDAPSPAETLRIVQPQDGPRDRVLSTLRLTVDDGASFDVALRPESLEPSGQEVVLPEAVDERLTLEIVATTDPGFDPSLANAVGIAEVRLGDLVVEETVRMPLDLLERAGDRSDALSLDLVMTRLRTDPDVWHRSDDEERIDRTVDLPSPRRFALSGTARPAGDVAGPVLDALLGTGGPVEVSASSRLQGDADARASRAFDGDPSTRWTSAFGAGPEQWIELRTPGPVAVGDVELDVVADGRHAVPVVVAVEVDGREVARHEVEVPADAGGAGHLEQVVLPLGGASTTGSVVRIRIDAVRTPDRPGGADLPVAIAEIRGLGVAPLPSEGTVDGACREDLVVIDGASVPVRLEPGDDETLAVSGCGPVDLDEGAHRVLGLPGEDSGVDIDQVLLSSGPDGEPAAVAARGADAASAPATLVGSTTDRTVVEADVDAAGDPFWFVLAQSDSAGWSLDVDGGTAGPRTLVDGYADGWLITPDGPGRVSITATWRPQTIVWLALGLSGLAVAVAIGIVVGTPAAPVPHPGAPPRWRGRRASRVGADAARDALVAGALTGAVVTLGSRPWIGLVAAAVAGIVALRPPAAWGVAISAPMVLGLSQLFDAPQLGWLALGLVVAVVAADLVRARRTAGG